MSDQFVKSLCNETDDRRAAMLLMSQHNEHIWGTGPGESVNIF
jgi:hypothetical protein